MALQERIIFQGQEIPIMFTFIFKVEHGVGILIINEHLKVVIKDPNIILAAPSIFTLIFHTIKEFSPIRKAKTILEIGKKFNFYIVMVLGIKVVENSQLFTEILSFILEVITLLSNSWRIYNKKSAFSQKQKELL